MMNYSKAFLNMPTLDPTKVFHFEKLWFPFPSLIWKLRDRYQNQIIIITSSLSFVKQLGECCFRSQVKCLADPDLQTEALTQALAWWTPEKQSPPS